MMFYDVVIIGGGAAGLAAAISAKEEGIDSLLILEREDNLGGILNQCIHSGYGMDTFQEEMTGPEFAQRLIDKVNELNIEYKLNTTVVELAENKVITAISPEDGILELQANSIILALGRRERPEGIVNILGSQCAGIFTAGTAQKFINVEGYMPGKEVVILGSGNIGLAMATRLILEGAKVKAVVETKDNLGKHKNKIREELEDFGIPLLMKHTLVNIHGTERVEGVTIAEVDENGTPIKETEKLIKCDSVLFSVDLVPENELLNQLDIEISDITEGPLVDENMETKVKGIFACGNIVYVHNSVDDIVPEASEVGKRAARADSN